jgi:hypothetical protein
LHPERRGGIMSAMTALRDFLLGSPPGWVVVAGGVLAILYGTVRVLGRTSQEVRTFVDWLNTRPIRPSTNPIIVTAADTATMTETAQVVELPLAVNDMTRSGEHVVPNVDHGGSTLVGRPGLVPPDFGRNEVHVETRPMFGAQAS